MSNADAALTFPRGRWIGLLFEDGLKLAGLTVLVAAGVGISVAGLAALDGGVCLLALGVPVGLGGLAALVQVAVQTRRDWLRGWLALAWDEALLTSTQLPSPPRRGGRWPWWSTLVTHRIARSRVVAAGRTVVDAPLSVPAYGGLVLLSSRNLYWLDVAEADGSVRRDVFDERWPEDRVEAALARLASEWSIPLRSGRVLVRPARSGPPWRRPSTAAPGDGAAWQPSTSDPRAIPVVAEVVSPGGPDADPQAVPSALAAGADDLNPYASPRAVGGDPTTWSRAAALAVCPAGTVHRTLGRLALIGAAFALVGTLTAVATLAVFGQMPRPYDRRMEEVVAAATAVGIVATILLFVLGSSGIARVRLHADGIAGPKGRRMEWGNVGELVWVLPPGPPAPGTDVAAEARAGPPILIVLAIGRDSLALSCPAGSPQRAFARTLWEEVAPRHLSRAVTRSFTTEAEALAPAEWGASPPGAAPARRPTAVTGEG